MKNLLLAKSNLRKNKGISICIVLLILLSSMFICVSGLLVFDYQQNSYRVAKSLDTTQVELYSFGDSSSINETYIEGIIPKTVDDYIYFEHLNIQTSIEFNGGEVTPNVNIINSTALNRRLSKIEIIEEDKSIKENYIYLPYHIHTGGGINIGDTYKLKLSDKTYTFKVKGFINTIYSGSYNMNKYEMMISDKEYGIIEKNNPTMKAFTLYINYKDSVKDINKESQKIVNKILIDKGVETSSYDLDITLESRTFLSMIFFASFLLTSFIVIGIVMLMIFNNISNYIRENVKSIGVLKAVGYTTKDIKKSQLIQFSILTSIGLIIGVIGGYLFMPLITKMLIGQSGIPYHIKFNLPATLIPMIVIPLFVFSIVLLTIKKIKKVEPIIALRDGIETHNFKKNHIPLDKSILSINGSLAIKNMFKSIKQNIISFIIVVFLCFLMVIAMTMYQNFSRSPKLSLLTFEIADGVILIDEDIKDDFVNDLKNDKDIKSFEYLTNYEIQDNDYIQFVAYIMENPKQLKNKDNCYKGRYPKYDNEIAISGKYAKEKNLNIGDKIEFHVGEKKYNYLITGFIQSTNNNGHESVLTTKGANHIIDKVNPMYYFESKVKAKKIIEKYEDKYKDKIIITLDFDELLESQMDTFISVANLMVVMMAIISGCIILLVLYLLMKTLIYNRRYEYGILKAVGYRSRDLIIQNVLSFMPTIIIATLIGTFISYYITNPYIGFMMRSFGIMKCTMVIPMDLMIITVLFIIGVSLIGTVLMSLRIRKIEPKNLLIGE